MLQHSVGGHREGPWDPESAGVHPADHPRLGLLEQGTHTHKDKGLQEVCSQAGESGPEPISHPSNSQQTPEAIWAATLQPSG